MWTDTDPRPLRPEGDPPPAFTALLLLGIALVLGLWAYAAVATSDMPLSPTDYNAPCAAQAGGAGCR